MALCENPFMKGDIPCPCGKCDPCIKARKNKWKNRVLFEDYDHEYSSFVTLTYSEENLRFQNPVTGEFGFPTLVPEDLRNFLKRIRRAVEPTKLRFYACGEYGDRNWRPHYHLALFGYEPCYRPTGTRRDLLAPGKLCCPPCDLLYKKWGLGVIDNAPINDKTAAYIAGYINKKLTKSTDDRLEGRFPEFQRMSNRPGIGANAVAPLAEALFSSFGKSMLTDTGDVPAVIYQGGKPIFLDRYIRDKLRDAIGVNDATKEATKQAYSEKLLSLYEAALYDPDVSPQKKPYSLKHFIEQRDKQKIINLKAKDKIYKKRRDL
jgi:hypothetical protein